MNVEWLMALQDPDFRKAFGVRLKELRKQKRWSQKEMAAKVEIRFQQKIFHSMKISYTKSYQILIMRLLNLHTGWYFSIEMVLLLIITSIE